MKLNKETGVLTFGKYVISPHLTYPELLEKYPDIKLERDEQTPSRLRERIFRLPPIFFHDHRVDVRIVCYTQYISGIYISRVYSEQTDNSEFWTTKLVDWTKQAHNWLSDQLGTPHRIERGELYDEKEHMSEDDVAILRSWEYIFDWGKVLYYFDSLQQPGEICIRSDYHYRIRSWDELLSQVNYYANLGEHKTENYEPIINAITSLREHFDYLKLRPIVRDDLGGLIFDMKQWSHWDDITRVFLDVNIKREGGIYRISRPDSLRKAYTSNLHALVEAVKYFTSEHFVR